LSDSANSPFFTINMAICLRLSSVKAIAGGTLAASCHFTEKRMSELRKKVARADSRIVAENFQAPQHFQKHFYWSALD